MRQKYIQQIDWRDAISWRRVSENIKKSAAQTTQGFPTLNIFAGFLRDIKRQLHNQDVENSVETVNIPEELDESILICSQYTKADFYYPLNPTAATFCLSWELSVKCHIKRSQ